MGLNFSRIMSTEKLRILYPRMGTEKLMIYRGFITLCSCGLCLNSASEVGKF
jgi:hypothetical protein